MKIKAFTLTDRRSSRIYTLGFCKAFTLAEILISLTIIGIIAALTLPALMANLNEKVWNTKRKALHSRMAQALAAMPNLDRYQATDDNTETFNFINNGLATSLNITKVCNQDNMSKCDFAWPERTMNDDEFDPYNKWTSENVESFNTVNGESIGVIWYNPDCRGESAADFLTTDLNKHIENMICADFIYDLNGASKGPNKVGKDMGFITAYFPEYPLVVAPMPTTYSIDMIDIDDAEEYITGNSDSRLPGLAEAASIALNVDFIIADGGGNSDSILAHNGYMCNFSWCDKINPGHMVLVNKNGDAPKNLQDFEQNAIIVCSEKYPNACKTKGECEKVGGTWYVAKPNGYCK